MVNLLIAVGVNALALWVTTLLYPGVYFARGHSLLDALVAGLVLGIVNALIRPVLLLLSLPVTVLTLGLFMLVVNAVVLLIVAGLTPLEVRGFGAAIIGAVILAIVSWVLDTMLHVRKERK